MSRPMHRVSVKIAFLNKKGDKVLMTCLHDGGYGLPGGHIEIGETPEQALKRELHEELNFACTEPVERIDFWRDLRTERIILGYSATMSESEPLQPDSTEIAGLYWASLADFDSNKVATITYEPFIRRVFAKE